MSFPFPPEVKSARPSGQGGLFVDTPQTLMAWGVIYFALMTLCELMIFRKSAKTLSGTPAESISQYTN
ncbi:MAG: hypothetical protein ACE5EO_10520 [Candidatus Krumholzibacteriia bacterium]